jgi:hypothetical protein
VAPRFAGERRWAEPAAFGVADANAAAGSNDLADRGADTHDYAEIVGLSDADPVSHPEPNIDHRSG